MTMTKAAIYIRVSTARQAEEGFSLDEQERRALAHIERAGWEHAGTYREEGVSGAKQHRPQLDRLLADLPNLGAVVVPSLDRLGRSTRHLLEPYERLEAADVVLVSLRESLDTSTSVGRLIRTVLSAVAEFERDIGRERTSAGIAGRARKEAKPWGVPGLGYTRGEAGHWAIEPAEAEVVRRIYMENVRHGRSFAGIARLLNSERVPTRRGSRWAPNVIRRVLSSRHVLGEFEHDGEWHMGRHDAIIDQATWDAAQVQAEAGRKYAPNGRAGPLPKRHLLIRGMGRCGLCGDALLPRTGPPEAYVCRRHKLDTSACLMPVLPRAAVETAMLDMFERTALSVAETQRHVAEQLEGRSSSTRAQAERAADEALRMRKALDRAARDYAAGDLGAANFERLTA